MSQQGRSWQPVVAPTDATSPHPCRITDPAASLRSIRVTAGPVEFTQGVREVPVVVQLERGRTAVEVLAPLRFEGEYSLEHLPLRSRGEYTAYAGRLTVGARALHADEPPDGGELRFSIEKTLGVHLEQPLSIPCAELRLRSEDFDHTPGKLRVDGVKEIGLGPNFIPLHRSPNDGNALFVHYAGAWSLRERVADWLRVDARWNDGSRLSGWVADSYMEASFALNFTFSEQGRSDHGCGGSPPPHVAWALLQKGAEVASQPGGSTWAQATHQVQVKVADLHPEAQWVQIIELPGLLLPHCAPYGHVWVRRASLVKNRLVSAPPTG